MMNSIKELKKLKKMDKNVLNRLSISLEYQLKIINLIKKMDDYIEHINEIISHHGDNWYEPYAVKNGFRDRKVSIQDKKDILINHLVKIRAKYYEGKLNSM